MKIAFLAQSYPPMISGAALVVQQLAHGMVARGHDVLVIAASDTGQAYLTQEPHLKVVRLKSTHNPSRYNQHFISWAYADIYDELRAFSPEVIHLHDSLSVGLAGVLAGKKLRIPLALTTHQLPGFVSAYLPNVGGVRETVERLLWKYCRWLFENTQQFISPTETSAKMIEKHVGFHPLVISNGMDLNHFRPKAMNQDERRGLCIRYGLDPARPIILHVGRLDLDKQVNVVIRAAAKAIHNANAQLLIVGDGQQREKLEQLAEWYGIREQCRFAGFVQPTGDLPALYRLASVFVTASEIETQGLVLLEAMASGLPVVAVRATCIPEIVHEGVNGYLVSPGDVEAMAQRLVDVMRQSTGSRQMGEAARRIAELHSHARTLTLHEGVYEALIAPATPVCKEQMLPFGGNLKNVFEVAYPVTTQSR